MVYRSSKLSKLQMVSRKAPLEVGEAIIGSLPPMKEFVHTLRSDSGKKFAGHIHNKPKA